MPILSLQAVSKSYGSTHVLENVSLDIEAGEVVVIVGFSGAGKSTLISLLCGLDRPDAGEVIFKGSKVTAPGPERMLVFQNYSLLPWLSAYDNVALAVDQVFASWSKEKRHTHIERFISMVGLEHARDRKPAQLSGGMRQRVALARALATDPEVLLMDEPLSALDALTREAFDAELQRLWSERARTIVLVTHSVSEAVALADLVAVMTPRPGRIARLVPVGLERPRTTDLATDPRAARLVAEVRDALSEAHAVDVRPWAEDRGAA